MRFIALPKLALNMALCCGLLASCAAEALAQSNYYVRPGATGKGISAQDAFGTIEQARDAIRARGDVSIKSDITVHLLPGTYFLKEPLTFDNRDSGRNGFKVIYRASDLKQRPVLSGGRRIMGPWQPQANGIFAADAGAGVFRQLYINNVPAIVARDPNSGWKRLKQWEDRYGSKSVRLHGPDNLKKQWQRQEQIEFVTKFHWAIARLHLGAWNTYDNDNVIFPPEQNIWSAIAPRENNQHYYLENALEFLDQPGEFYLDQGAKRVYYKPRAGENLQTASVIVPQLDHLLVLKGADGNRPVTNIQFSGLRFEHSNWLHTTNTKGYVGAQGQLMWNEWVTGPGAVELSYTQGIHITDCSFRNLGGVGLKLAKGTNETHIEGNTFSTIGDTGILVYTGPVNPKDNPIPETDQSRNDVIRNNYVEKTGRETLQGAGIAVVMARNIVVEHNEVTEAGYAGITFGYFTAPLSPSVGNKIQYNYVHHVMQELDDGAGIYIFHTKFDAPHNNSNLLIYRNFVHDVYRGPQSDSNPIAGIYLDEGTRGNIIKENVVRNVGNWLHLNTGGGTERETLPERQQLIGNVDENPAWEKAAGVQPQYASILPYKQRKPTVALPKAELVAHLTFDRNDVTSSGSLQGTPSLDTGDKKVEQGALQLDGKTQWSETPKVNLANRFTVAMWVKIPPQASGDITFFNSPGLKLWAYVEGNGKPVMQVNTEAKGQHGVEVKDIFKNTSNPGAFPVGEWVHLALTLDRYHAQARLFVNGKDVTKTNHFGRDDFAIPTSFILGRHDEGKKPFSGHIDDLRIYREVLRPGEIMALANAGR